MPLDNKNSDGIYRVRTLIDSGSGSNRIATDILPNINYTLIGHKHLRVRTFGKEVVGKYKIVQIYFEDNKVKYAVRCYVIEDFLKHILVKGLKEYIRNNTQLEEEVIDRIIDPTEDVDHKEGTGLVLSHGELSLITKERDSGLCLPDQQLILDDTYFGIAISGKVPNCLLRDTHISQAKWVIPEVFEPGEEMWIYQIDAQEEKETEAINECES